MLNIQKNKGRAIVSLSLACLLLFLCGCGQNADPGLPGDGASGAEAAALPSLGAQLSEPVLPPEKDLPVVFIADGGTGDGNSPDSPLAVLPSGNASPIYNGKPCYYYDSVLYQAAAKLYGSGGTIVIVGDVFLSQEISRYFSDLAMDYPLPWLGGGRITITSRYDGVDYREENGARLILQSSVSLSSNNPISFENVDICTIGVGNGNGTNVMLFGCGFPLIVGEGVNCIPLSADFTPMAEPSTDCFPSLVGGQLIDTVSSCCSVEVHSGSYFSICGGSAGIDSTNYGTVLGDCRMLLADETTVYSSVSGTSLDGKALVYGDVDITVTGGQYYGKLMMCSKGGMGSSASRGRLTVSGGNFGGKYKFLASAGKTAGYPLAETFFDCTECEEDVAARASGFSSVACKANELSDPVLDLSAVKTDYYAGETADLSGIRLSGKVGEDEVSTGLNSLFSFTMKNGSALIPGRTRLGSGSCKLSVSYGDLKLGTLKLEVKDCPAVEILGATLVPDAEKQSLGFLIGVEDRKVSGLDILGTGICVMPEGCLLSEAELTDGSFAGAERIAAAALPDGLYREAEGTGAIVSHAAVEDIPVEEYDLLYSAAAYLTFSDKTGEHTVYSPVYTASVYSVALNAVSSSASEPFLAEIVRKTEAGEHGTKDEAAAQEKADAAVAYMAAMGSQKWVSPADINFAGAVSWTGALRYEKGVTYTGLPYLAGSNGVDNLESFLETLDDDGVYTGSVDWYTMHGNNCTSAGFQSVARVSNHYAYYQRLMDPIINIFPLTDGPDAPFCKVGDYEVRYTDLLSTVVAGREDPAVMFDAYSKVHPGDYLYCYWDGGGELLAHLRLISGVHTVYNENGTVNGLESYITVDEQTSTVDVAAHSNWGVDRAFSFASLNSGGYLPIRDMAFETGYFETPCVYVRNANNAENVGSGLSGMIRSNYDITNVRLQILKSDSGECVFEDSEVLYFTRAFSVASFDPKNTLAGLGSGYEYILTVTSAGTERELVRFTF